MTHGALFLAVFLACVVEAVEATTIVLAAGTARSWRSAASGLVVALAVLAGVIAILGPAVSAMPLRGLRLVVTAAVGCLGGTVGARGDQGHHRHHQQHGQGVGAPAVAAHEVTHVLAESGTAAAPERGDPPRCRDILAGIAGRDGDVGRARPVAVLCCHPPRLPHERRPIVQARGPVRAAAFSPASLAYPRFARLGHQRATHI